MTSSKADTQYKTQNEVSAVGDGDKDGTGPSQAFRGTGEAQTSGFGPGKEFPQTSSFDETGNKKSSDHYSVDDVMCCESTKPQSSEETEIPSDVTEPGGIEQTDWSAPHSDAATRKLNPSLPSGLDKHTYPSCLDKSEQSLERDSPGMPRNKKSPLLPEDAIPLKLEELPTSSTDPDQDATVQNGVHPSNGVLSHLKHQNGAGIGNGKQNLVPADFSKKPVQESVEVDEGETTRLLDCLPARDVS